MCDRENYSSSGFSAKDAGFWGVGLAFGLMAQEIIVPKLLKRAKMETLDTKLFGPAITNLGRLDFPTTYGSLELDRLIMQPGGAFPLVHVDMVLGAVTCVGKLSLVIEYAEEAVDTATIIQIQAKARGLLLGG